jgi:hypothetical protein
MPAAHVQKTQLKTGLNRLDDWEVHINFIET